ncbi:MAG: hypothetical protein GQ574_11330 [Crocinitomix sp.]|nr:hypothetical protein [Crocinitomix sp.]
MNAKYNAVHFGVKITISDENLIHLMYPPDIDFGLKQAKRVDKVIIEQLGSENYSLIVDLTDSFGSMTKEAQKFFAQDAPSIPQITASAIIVNNLPIRILAKFYLNFFKPRYPTKIFPSLEPAKIWLNSIEDKDANHALNVG